MARVAAGDMAALGTLFERFKQPLFRFLYRLLRQTAPAEDLLQEAFLRVYDRRRHYKPGMRFATWLYTIAYHLAVDSLRREARCEIRDDLDAELAAPHDDYSRAETARAVRDALAELPAEQRTVLILREYEGFSYREVARIVGCSEEAARVRGHRARQALRQRLTPLLRESCETP